MSLPKKPKRRFVKPSKRRFILFGLMIHRDPNDLCGGRRLTGVEFVARKRELEAREAKVARV